MARIPSWQLTAPYKSFCFVALDTKGRVNPRDEKCSVQA